MKRSAIPMVVGVLMIVFGGIALVASLVSLESAGQHALAKFPAVVLGMFEVLVALLQLDAGVACVRYLPSATSRAVAFAFARIALTIAALLVTWLTAGFTGWFALVLVGSLAWPAIVIALMTRRSVKGAV